MVVFLLSLLRCPPFFFFVSDLCINLSIRCGQVSELLQGFSELSGSKAAIWFMVIFQPGRTAGKAEVEGHGTLVFFSPKKLKHSKTNQWVLNLTSHWLENDGTFVRNIWKKTTTPSFCFALSQRELYFGEGFLGLKESDPLSCNFGRLLGCSCRFGNAGWWKKSCKCWWADGRFFPTDFLWHVFFLNIHPR